MKTFNDFGINKEITQILVSLGYKNTFEVQEKIIPLCRQKKAVVFTAKTGSGKTLAYSLGFLDKINFKLGTQMLVIVPTRELANQVGEELTRICDRLHINVGVLHGGREIKGDYRTLNRKNHIIVATPGRLIQHINSKAVKAGEVKYLVFDESDQMFDNGFYHDCGYIIKRAAKHVQIILSSATITEKVQNFIDEQIVDYEFVKVGEDIPKKIIQEKMYCSMEEKNDLLLKFLARKHFKKALVFCNTKVKSYKIADLLNKNKFKTESMSSDLMQYERENNLNSLKSGKIKVLVTTDIAARGLDISKVDIVINYDVPPKTEFYVHRIGRSGRIGNIGYAMTMICPEDDNKFAKIEFDYKLEIDEIDKDFNIINQNNLHS
jgi:ATP-dependent RNA helicase DeaD